MEPELGGHTAATSGGWMGWGAAFGADCGFPSQGTAGGLRGIEAHCCAFFCLYIPLLEISLDCKGGYPLITSVSSIFRKGKNGDEFHKVVSPRPQMVLGVTRLLDCSTVTTLVKAFLVASESGVRPSLSEPSGLTSSHPSNTSTTSPSIAA